MFALNGSFDSNWKLSTTSGSVIQYDMGNIPAINLLLQVTLDYIILYGELPCSLRMYVSFHITGQFLSYLFVVMVVTVDGIVVVAAEVILKHNPNGYGHSDYKNRQHGYNDIYCYTDFR